MDNTILKEVYEVFGKALPERHVYGASSNKPVTTFNILRKFKTWAKFAKAYSDYVGSQRQKAVTKNVETKKVSAKKVVVKDED